MFRVDKSTNRIFKLDARRFSDLGLGERGDLQEWIAGTPETLGEELLIIQKEFDGFAEDFMISMATKGAEKKSTEDAQRRSHKVRLEFWEQALGALRARGLKRYQSISPSTDHWLSCATGVSGCNYTLIFLKQEVRVELTLQRSRTEDNKWFFDRLEEKREEIESDFGEALEWNRMGDKKSSKIRLVRPFDGHDPVCWPEIITWFGDHISRLEDAFSTHLERLNQEFKSGDANS